MPKQISCAALRDMLATGEAVYLLDVRQEWEHDFARLPNDTLIPLGELADRIPDVEPPPSSTIVVYCHHGVRSLTGAAILEANGFAEAYSLAGGIDAWSRMIDPAIPRY